METLAYIFTVGALVGFCILREVQWRQERSELFVQLEKLLNRIQAPQMAVVADQEPTGYVAPDDDEGYWESVAERED